MTTFKLFTEVLPFYQALETAVAQAQHTIHMAYFAFDQGEWAQRIGAALREKAAAGVAVHLMVDEAGQVLDNPRNGWCNRQLMAALQAGGVAVTLFRPQGRRLGYFNRLHCKFCAIDGRIAFIGGSNIGDHYLHWRDSNLQITGELGDGLVQLYQLLSGFGGKPPPKVARPNGLQIAGIPLLLTLPGHRQDIRRALLDMVLAAETAVTLRSWYFLPDQEIMNALLSQAERGIQVTILFSHRTRVPPIDWLNRWLTRDLLQAGARIFRYAGRYMHAKEAWNDQGCILIGSANIDRWAMCSTFECSLHLKDQALAEQLAHALHEDTHCCIAQSANESGPEAECTSSY
jgi:cardiolipin synthase A/B